MVFRNAFVQVRINADSINDVSHNLTVVLRKRAHETTYNLYHCVPSYALV
jgi:hypothetical protein